MDKNQGVVHSKIVDNVDKSEPEQRFCASCKVDHKIIFMSLADFDISGSGRRRPGKLIFCEQPGKKLNKFMVSVTMYKIDWKENGREETK